MVADELQIVQEFKVGVELHSGPGAVGGAVAVPTPLVWRRVVLGGDGRDLLGRISVPSHLLCAHPRMTSPKISYFLTPSPFGLRLTCVGVLPHPVLSISEKFTL